MKKVKHTFYCVVFFIILPGIITAQTPAHQQSKFAVVDPSYNSRATFPLPGIDSTAARWAYGPSELECYRLQLLQRRKDSAKLIVGFPGVFHLPYEEASFRLQLTPSLRPGVISFRASGSGKILVNGKLFHSFKDADNLQVVSLQAAANISTIEFIINDPGGVPALQILTPALSTSAMAWQWKAAGEDWQSTHSFYSNTANMPPHQYENPTIRLQPLSVENNVYDFGKELLGYLFFETKQRPQIVVGESVAEAFNTHPTHFEQLLELDSVANGLWKSKVPLAYRYVRTNLTVPLKNIYTDAIFHPAIYKGAFSCSDTLLTRIWMNSAYTLRLCMQDFLLDGIKRDRLPWTGDMAMSILVNSYTFSDPEMVRRSLVALGRAGIQQKDINGIVDYSLWWIISQDMYQLYYADKVHLQQEWNRIKETLALLDQRSDEKGFLTVQKSDWVFIDWVSQPKWTALQIMWWWAKRSGAKLAARMGDAHLEKKLLAQAHQLQKNLSASSWDATNQVWGSTENPHSEKTKHPNFLAVVSGITPYANYTGIGKLLRNDSIQKVGTPYMAGFEMMALARTGNVDAMLNEVKYYWGGMLAKGATTFWEAYDPSLQDDQQYSFYDRPFAKSLCHAWSAGPAAFLPMELLGIQPLEDGWKKFTLEPATGFLDEVHATVPTRYGNIIVAVNKSTLQVSIPKGTSLHWKGKDMKGPLVFRDELKSR